MKSTTTVLLFLLGAGLFPQDISAQRRKSAPQTTVPQKAAPNVSGQPDYITAPDMEKPTPQSQPDIKVNVKKQRRVRVVPAPPPGPPATPLPPRK